ncbi:AAA family ATPase [Azorhizobium doebereinerae]|uniref:AAA family ATPase n=1 Tax=Azorhizobium doebereinerae TaxID=281091 RepID=UPI00048BC44D|nr:AAA family ATPase [Azorhizobium doebereinerae]
MTDIVSTISSMRGMGILADYSKSSPKLPFRRYNLIYGFNGSGKSTLSRLFASLETGERHERLPEECSFEIEMDSGAKLSCPAALAGLERRVLVFNADYVERNFQWAQGRANPVFFIGADQAEAAAELSAAEARIPSITSRKSKAEGSLTAAEKAFTAYKRTTAKTVASRLHLGNRKYEAPALVKDHDAWAGLRDTTLTDEQLAVQEDICKLDTPPPAIAPLTFDAQTVKKAFEFIRSMCEQSFSTTALAEAQQHPDMLIWLKEGFEFHKNESLDVCLMCGSPFPDERLRLLASALDDRIDEFMSRLQKAGARLEEVLGELTGLDHAAPQDDDLVAMLREDYKARRGKFAEAVRTARAHLEPLKPLVEEKLKKPASPVDVGRLPSLDVVVQVAGSLASEIANVNGVIGDHNQKVEAFSAVKSGAEELIRKHFVAKLKGDFDASANAVTKAITARDAAQKELEDIGKKAEELRRRIRTHGPAATAINSLVASYLGHQELTIQPLETGYALHRHGQEIKGFPSEGEKTAIAIAYFLSSLEADGRKLKDLIVVVDDPISSLDTKALNYACSLVKSRLEKACQVFILTHNQQCMNEFKKAWKNKTRREEGKEGHDPQAALFFIDVRLPKNTSRRTSHLVEMSKLLREYDSEYHYLFSHVIKFSGAPDEHYDHGYMMPNVLRRVLDIFLAFKAPVGGGIVSQMNKLFTGYPDLDRVRFTAVERLRQVESHSDNLDDLLSFSSMTLEEIKGANAALLALMGQVDAKHLKALTSICR